MGRTNHVKPLLAEEYFFAQEVHARNVQCNLCRFQAIGRTKLHLLQTTSSTQNMYCFFDVSVPLCADIITLLDDAPFVRLLVTLSSCATTLPHPHNVKLTSELEFSATRAAAGGVSDNQLDLIEWCNCTRQGSVDELF